MSTNAFAAPPSRVGTGSGTGTGIRRTRRKPDSDRTRVSSKSAAMLYLAPLRFAGKQLQFHSFDAGYIESLRAGEMHTEEHFVGYFTQLLHLKLRSRLQSPQAIEDVRQETFARVLSVLRKEDGLRQPDRLGAFVNTVCNNVLLEQYRTSARSQSLDEENQPEIPATGIDALGMLAAKQMREKVHQILLKLPERDRALLQAVFIEEMDRDEVCEKFSVDREYLRVLLFRAKQEFKAEYMKKAGNPVAVGA